MVPDEAKQASMLLILSGVSRNPLCAFSHKMLGVEPLLPLEDVTMGKAIELFEKYPSSLRKRVIIVRTLHSIRIAI
jgi:glutaredoxin-related protein